MKSPQRKRIVDVYQDEDAINAPIRSMYMSPTTTNAAASNVFGSQANRHQQQQHQTVSFPQPPQRVNSNSILRSPGKVGLNLAASMSKSPAAARGDDEADKENNSRAAQHLPNSARSPLLSRSATKSQSAASTSQRIVSGQPKADSRARSTTAPGTTGLPVRSPVKNAYVASAPSSPRQLLSPIRQQSYQHSRAASPTPRPPSRLVKTHLQPFQADLKSPSNTPVKVVDNVFMVGAGENEEEDEDDEEVADILLGYAKTPAGNKVGFGSPSLQSTGKSCRLCPICASQNS